MERPGERYREGHGDRDTVRDMVRDTVRDMVRDVGCCNLLHFSHSYDARIKFFSSTPPFQNNLQPYQCSR